MYIVGETTFGKAIDSVEPQYMSIVDNINQSGVEAILNSTPHMDNETKDEIFCELINRIDRVQDLIFEKEFEHGRDH
jgi:hypothetical protein